MVWQPLIASEAVVHPKIQQEALKPANREAIKQHTTRLASMISPSSTEVKNTLKFWQQL